METLHLEIRYTGNVTLPEDLIEKLPQKIIICSIIQYLDILEQVEEQLIKAGKQVSRFKSIHGSRSGQILGCDIYKVPGDFDCFLFVGDGLFHPTALLYENKKPVFTYSPIQKSWHEYSQQDLEKVQKKRKAALSTFYMADKVGVLLTIKQGQAPIQSRKIRDIENMFPDKEFFYFLSDTINLQQLENYPFIQSWVNTACPRIIEDEALTVNLRDIIVAHKTS